MSKDFVWDYEAAGELLLQSEEIAAVCEEEAERLSRATGMDYIYETKQGKKRVRVKGKSKKRWRRCPKCGKAHPNCKCAESGSK